MRVDWTSGSEGGRARRMGCGRKGEGPGEKAISDQFQVMEDTWIEEGSLAALGMTIRKCWRRSA
jgi:hypothetical protein